MATISKTGISNGSTIESEHITRIVDALDGTSSAEIIATGSFTGSFTGNMSGTASFATTASFALNAGGSPSYYTINFNSPSDNPADATTYYVGNAYRLLTIPTRATPPKAMISGTLSYAFFSCNIQSSGSDELSTLSIWNMDTDVSASLTPTDPTKLVMNDFSTYVTSSLSPGLTVNDGDRIIFKLETPTWTSNPTGVTCTGYVLIQI
jgi:hypothetical protein